MTGPAPSGSRVITQDAGTGREAVRCGSDCGAGRAESASLPPAFISDGSSSLSSSPWSAERSCSSASLARFVAAGVVSITGGCGAKEILREAAATKNREREGAVGGGESRGERAAHRLLGGGVVALAALLGLQADQRAEATEGLHHCILLRPHHQG